MLEEERPIMPTRIVHDRILDVSINSNVPQTDVRVVEFPPKRS